jgi:hypothetical protein
MQDKKVRVIMQFWLYKQFSIGFDNKQDCHHKFYQSP